ncbi:MAG: hypothetical protein KDD54_04695 [Flavobacteriales bacterium]|nr:hypothetical protein [Flavobacteriales bacterium]
MVQDVSVIIRSVSERTEKQCHEAVCAQVPEGHVRIVKERPFSNAVRATYRVGMEMGLKWTIGLDADVILTTRAIRQLVSFANAQPAEVFEVQGRILDKLFCIPKSGGPHAYRTSLLDKAMAFIPEEGSSLRPESAAFVSMKKIGHPFVHGEQVFGVHDFEQYYMDIYRKAFVHAHKFEKFRDVLLKSWKAMAETDPDYQVAIRGFLDGISHKGQVYINRDHFETSITRIKGLETFQEKQHITDPLHATYADHLIEGYKPDDDLKNFEIEMNPLLPLYRPRPNLVKAFLKKTWHYLNR